jgi:hypothetical protein
MLDGVAVGEQLYEDDMMLYRLERSPQNSHLYINEHAIQYPAHAPILASLSHVSLTIASSFSSKYLHDLGKSKDTCRKATQPRSHAAMKP